jgi:hypothetical protein
MVASGAAARHSSAGLAALERLAEAAPEDPWAFFRGERGQFRWWSHSRAWRESAAAAAESQATAGSAVPRELLARLAAGTEAEAAAAHRLLEVLGPPPQREVWISWRRLDAGAEGVLLLASQLAGWAVVREPGEALHPQVFAWARPTLLAGSGAELAALLDGFAAAAPRPLRGRWLRRRLARLRAVIVDDGSDPAALARRVGELGGEARGIAFGGPA